MFYCEEERILISGDALWEHGFGIVLCDPPDGLKRARQTLQSIAALDVAVVIPGHGRPFSEVTAALERSFHRLDALAADSARLARAAMKAMLSFTLLDKRAMSLDELVELIARVPFYRQQNDRFFCLPPAALAELIVGELEKAGALRRDAGLVYAR